MSLQDEVNRVVLQARKSGTDNVAVEIKRAAGGEPKTLPETISAFANGSGGLIILGLEERSEFTPVPINARSLADSMITACSDRVEPAIRARVEILEVDGSPVVVAAIPPVSVELRPCYVKTQGMENGSYIRAHDGDRHLTSYEIHLMVSGRGQPQDDSVPVKDATVDDLDPDALDRLLARFRRQHGRIFGQAQTSDVLRMVGVCPRRGEDDQVTLAGLMALGRYPQEFFPQLNVTFVAYPTVSGRMMSDGTRFLENVAIDGSIPEMVTGLVNVVTHNMTRRSVMVGIGREDHWEYPIEAVRELAVNALMHRDYHPLAQGAQVRVEMYPDRLLFNNPGGLYGAATPSELLQGAVSSTRNALLARLLEDVQMPMIDRTVCENRGSGLRMVAHELTDEGLQLPIFRTTVATFNVEIRNRLGHDASRNANDTTSVTSTVSTSTVSENAVNTMAEGADKQILRALASGPKAANELTQSVGLKRSGLGTRLRSLEKQGLVLPIGSRHSPKVRWALADGVTS